MNRRQIKDHTFGGPFPNATTTTVTLAATPNRRIVTSRIGMWFVCQATRFFERAYYLLATVLFCILSPYFGVFLRYFFVSILMEFA